MKRLGSIVVSTVIITTLSLSNLAFAQTTKNGTMLSYSENPKLSITQVARFDSKTGDGGCEIISVAPKSGKAFVVNGAEKSLDIFKLSGIKADDTVNNLPLEKRISITEMGIESASDFTSVAVSPKETYVAVAIPSENATDKGYIAVLDMDGKIQKVFNAGSLPDMVTFTHDGRYILVANEGEPNDDFSIDPKGSVSIIDIKNGVNAAVVTEVSFDNVSVHSDVRRANPYQTYSQSLEPEYIAVSSDDKYAYVVCQESNAIATLDIEKKIIVSVKSLGVKDHSVKGNEMDASNKDDGINFNNYPVLGMYQPDGIDIISVNGVDYIVTPNEGDSQDYDGYSEEVRVADIVENIKLDAKYYKGYSQNEIDALVQNGLFEEKQLGRLKITTADGKEGDTYTRLYNYGGRSFSIFDARDMSLVYDSGSEFAKITSKCLPNNFNATNDEDDMDDRSDDKGIEPEDAEIGKIGNNTYAFIALESLGGIMVYDVTNPHNAKFDQYFTTRVFGGENKGDLAPEGQYFLSADKSPTNTALLFVSNEVSGTVSIFEIKEKVKEKATTPVQKPVPTVEAKTSKTYTVKAGDVLWKIAKKYNTTWEVLKEMNNLKNPNTIMPGQVIVLP